MKSKTEIDNNGCLLWLSIFDRPHSFLSVFFLSMQSLTFNSEDYYKSTLSLCTVELGEQMKRKIASEKSQRDRDDAVFTSWES